MCYGCWPGMVDISYKQIDYSKYLGPDWKDDRDKIPTIVVSNHSSFVDIIVQMYMGMPSFVSKDSVRKFPIIGQCAELYGCLFLKRENKESQRSTVSQIIQR